MAETTPSDQEAMIDTMFILVFVLSISFCSVLDPLVLHPTHERQTELCFNNDCETERSDLLDSMMVKQKSSEVQHASVALSYRKRSTTSNT